MTEAIISVHYSNMASIGLNLEKEYLTVLPLTTDLIRSECCIEECRDLWEEILGESLEGVTILEDKLYHTILKVRLIYSEDYWGEVDTTYEVEKISHSSIATWNVDRESWDYYGSIITPEGDPIFALGGMSNGKN